MRKDSVWHNRTGGYIETTSPTGYDVLINGSSKYLNFNLISGETGYGIRDNAGTMQFKNSGGSWTNFGAGGGGGAVDSVNGQTGVVVLTTADIADSADKRYVTDAQLTVIGNTSGTNTGDQTSIVGITGTKAQFDTAVTDGNFLYTDAIGVSVQAYDTDLTTWASITPGTGVGTALAIAVGSAGAFITNGGALGTPSSGTVTNLTGTASININGTVGATTPTTATFTTGTFNTSIELGHATQNTLTASSGIMSIEGVAIPTISSTHTLTNKRITKRVTTETSSATPTINTDNSDLHRITALATAITSFTTNLTGTPTDGQTLWIVITDDGTARAITWGASFEASTVALPTTTVISTRLDVGFIWNTVTSKWRCIANA